MRGSLIVAEDHCSSYELIKTPTISVLAGLFDSSAKRTISADLLILLFVSRQKKESNEAIRLSHVSCDLYVAFFVQFSNYCFIISSSNSLDRNSMNF